MSQCRITGITTIDDEHVELFELSQQLHDLIQEQLDESLTDAVSMLYAALHFHMRNEEHLIDGWCGYSSHVKIHRDAASKLEHIYNKIRKEHLVHSHSPAIHEFSNFVRSWLNDHVKEDEKYVTYLHSKQ
jgi:hemerythrin-like metal-binding protein